MTCMTAEQEVVRRLAQAERRRRGLATAPPAWVERYRDDVPLWCAECVQTYDPREEPERRWAPFVLHPRQHELIGWLEEREHRREGGLLEKSRGVGATWVAVAFALHRWLFRPASAIGFGSRKLDLVDRLGDPSSILEKARMILRKLPAEQLPIGFEWSRHAGLCRLINPANGSTITGEGGDQIGRGARTSLYIVDEAAFLEHPGAVDGSLSETTDVRIDISTPNGPAGPFYTKRHSGTVPVFTYSWHDDPRRDQAWADATAALLGPVVWASEYGIDYTASVSGILIPAAWVRAATGVALTWPDGARYEPAGARLAGLDIGEASNTLVLRQGPVVLSVEQWSGSLRDAIARAQMLCVEAGCSVVHYDADGPGHEVEQVLDEPDSETGRTLRSDAVRFCAVHGGHGASDAVCDDGRRASEAYANIRAESWWRLRRRFRLTWETAQGIAHPPDECISLPADAQLAVELSVPLMETTEAGKLRLEGKNKMAARGVASPHRADALAMTEAPVQAPLMPGGVQVEDALPPWMWH